MPYTTTHSPRPTRPLAAATVALTVILALYSLFVVVAEPFLSMSYGACGDPLRECNFAVGSALFYVTPAVALVALVATIVGISLRNRVGRSTWWVPLSGIGVMTVMFATNLVLIGWATDTL